MKAVDLKIYANEIELAARQQIMRSVESPAFEGAKIRIMPDVHAGKGSVIGFTAHVTNGRIIPNVVGVDIGCGMLIASLGKVNIDLVQLDRFIRKKIPSGMNVHPPGETDAYIDEDYLRTQFSCGEYLQNVDRLVRSVGTLGGGNHFIEIDVDEEGNKYLIVHSGSRNLGKQVAEYYQQFAIETCVANVPDDLAYLEGESAFDYSCDMIECIDYATRNRTKIAARICEHLGLDYGTASWEQVIHNYVSYHPSIGTIIRKGAISAQKGETVLIPLNMQQGCILGKGKGNADWNYSAPHGAGRVCSRRQAFSTLSMDEFKERMEGIYSTSVCRNTLDESPMAYKDPQYILDVIDETVADIKMLRPIYNFKAYEGRPKRY